MRGSPIRLHQSQDQSRRVVPWEDSPVRWDRSIDQMAYPRVQATLADGIYPDGAPATMRESLER